MPEHDMDNRISKLEAQVRRQEEKIVAAMTTAVVGVALGGLGVFFGRPSSGIIAIAAICLGLIVLPVVIVIRGVLRQRQRHLP